MSSADITMFLHLALLILVGADIKLTRDNAALHRATQEKLQALNDRIDRIAKIARH